MSIKALAGQGIIWLADEGGPKIWSLIVAFRWFIAIGILAAIFLVGGEEGERILLSWFDFNLELIRHLRGIPGIGTKLELFSRFINGERLLVFAEITFPILAVGWARRRFRVRVSRERRSRWDARFWLFVRQVIFPRREVDA